MILTDINYNILKYNLYEILNVPETAHTDQIKKNYIKLIKKFHPDKNSKIEEDIYHHIILAGQILLNTEARNKYNKYINYDKINSYIDLKNNFINDIKINNYTNNENTFEEKTLNLNKKHGYDETINNIKVVEKFSEWTSCRNQPFHIDKNEYKSINEFNDTFKKNKLKDSKFHNQIIEITSPMELSNHILGNLYTNLDDIDKLYVNDSIETSIFTSLDRAFLLYPELSNYNDDSINLESKLHKYKLETNKYIK